MQLWTIVPMFSTLDRRSCLIDFGRTGQRYYRAVYFTTADISIFQITKLTQIEIKRRIKITPSPSSNHLGENTSMPSWSSWSAESCSLSSSPLHVRTMIRWHDPIKLVKILYDIMTILNRNYYFSVTFIFYTFDFTDLFLSIW